MTALEITLSAIIYVILAIFVYKKLLRTVSNTHEYPQALALLASIFAPVTLLVHMVSSVFFEDWR